MLEPGEVIRPQMTEKTAIELAERVYGLKILTIKELVSYDDKNYLITVDPVTTNKNISAVSKDGYVLKVLNKTGSRAHVEAEHAMMTVLQEKGINVPFPVPNLEGQDMSYEKIYAVEKNNWEDNNDSTEERPYELNLVRLLRFLSGEIYHKTPYTAQSFFELGKYAARMTNVLSEFSHPTLTQHETLWDLCNVPVQSKFVYAIRDEENKALVNDVIQSFEREVVPRLHELPKGVIHGDFNEQNIIMEVKTGDKDKKPEDRAYNVKGVIDFGDANHTSIMFEVAMLITYMMIDSEIVNTLDVGGHVLAGYLSERQLSDVEMDLLRVCIAGRLCQSLTMGEYTYMQDPGNEYVLTTAANGWKTLRCIWGIQKEQLYKRWMDIIKMYNDK